MNLPAETINKIISDAAAGMTQRRLALEYGLSTSKIRKTLGKPPSEKKTNEFPDLQKRMTATLERPIRIESSMRKNILTIKIYFR